MTESVVGEHAVLHASSISVTQLHVTGSSLSRCCLKVDGDRVDIGNLYFCNRSTEPICSPFVLV